MRYTTAPLPFLGQKKDFAGRFAEALREFTGITTVVDLFGGSGLLAHTAKETRPDLRVVYNDHDNFTERLDHIEDTNIILSIVRNILKDEPKGKRITDAAKARVMAVIDRWGGVSRRYHHILGALLRHELRALGRRSPRQNVV
jgi:hypothetical protein